LLFLSFRPYAARFFHITSYSAQTRTPQKHTQHIQEKKQRQQQQQQQQQTTNLFFLFVLM
jgi:hypothetical protein